MILGWAVISTGRHAENKIAPAINAAPHAELVAVYSRDQQRADAFAERHGALTAYDSIESVLQDSRVDGVFIVSPNALHASQTIQAAQAGKHVLTEKPMATSIEDAIAMIQACRQHGVTLGVSVHLRTLPGSSLLNAPSDTDLAAPEMAADLEAGFGGGGYSALQRTAILQLTWDHVSSGLDGRESAFELHANGGVQAWRDRLRSWFDSYNDLANGVHQVLKVEMPTVDMHSLKERPHTARRAVDATQAKPN